jgi:hypothetical protein
MLYTIESTFGGFGDVLVEIFALPKACLWGQCFASPAYGDSVLLITDMEHYCIIHGSMANFDGSRPKSIGKTMTKDPGSRTQHQPTKLTYQCAEKLADVRNIQYFGTQLFHNHWHLYQKFGIDD